MFRVWSAACSSGEEPYSLAIYLAEHLAPAIRTPGRSKPAIFPPACWKRRNGESTTRKNWAIINPDLLHRHFQKGMHEWQGRFRVKEELRRRINFHQLNLLDGNYPFSHPFHVILCRNVMIYFDRPTQETLIRLLAEQLVPGGYLMVGHSESLSGIKHSLRLIQPAIYLKPV
jgi:chemotaxis protein methyltransferase CheR